MDSVSPPGYEASSAGSTPNTPAAWAMVAASLQRSAAGMGRWNLHEILVGLYKVAQRHAKEGVRDCIDGLRVTEKGELQDLLLWLDAAVAAYSSEPAEVSCALGVPRDQVVKLVPTSSVHQPAYYIALAHSRQCIILGIRGTTSIGDVLTDLTPSSEKFKGPEGVEGYAHHGMLEAAQFLVQTEGEMLQKLQEEFPGYEVVTVGHSLGAGTAALLALLLRGWGGKAAANSRTGGIAQDGHKTGGPTGGGGLLRRVRCVSYATPPVLSAELADLAAPFVTSVVLQNDVVPRVCPASLEDLRLEIQQTDWKDIVAEGSQGARLLAAYETTTAAVSPMIAAVEKGAGLKDGALAARVTAVTKTAAYTGLTRAMGSGKMARASKGWGMLSNFASAAIAVGGAAFSAAATSATESTSSGPSSGSTTSSSRSRAEASGLPDSVQQQQRQGPLHPLAPPKASRTPQLTTEQAERQRLFSPGLLYHIIRQPNPGAEPSVAGGPLDRTGGCGPDVVDLVQELSIRPSPSASGGGGHADLAVEEEDGKAGSRPAVWDGKESPQRVVEEGRSRQVVEGASSHRGVEEGSWSVVPRAVRHSVLRGVMGGCRFRRIVLSNNALTDHLTPAYREGLKDAIRYC